MRLATPTTARYAHAREHALARHGSACRSPNLFMCCCTDAELPRSLDRRRGGHMLSRTACHSATSTRRRRWHRQLPSPQVRCSVQNYRTKSTRNKHGNNNVKAIGSDCSCKLSCLRSLSKSPPESCNSSPAEIVTRLCRARQQQQGQGGGGLPGSRRHACQGGRQGCGQVDRRRHCHGGIGESGFSAPSGSADCTIPARYFCSFSGYDV
jgi:hypothetical protein